ncbi:helix-turn-helix transcriptional regulator [Patescibacteria group bacterium]|nr:helix-turn-helix transcriptional regulator [Patescibacteria group bacterium]MBU1682341.1 helix-turn-helix transcriptional regulator [Patescibacteria group bacterium]MBU1934713.1 helix-turn-helix transcriptional regulator [Patescibacteria group bacterium]
MRNYKDFKKQALKDKKIRKEYDNLSSEFAIAESLIEIRLGKGLTQAQLAKKIGTKQSAIARLESGNYNPTVNFLKRIAEALNLKLNISLS